MAGNSQRRGATRRKSKKGATVGSGGKRRKGLEGRGPTPKAEDRVAHKAHKAAAAARVRRDAARSARSPGPRGRSQHEIISGRNAVVEALRAQVPVATLYVAGRIEVIVEPAPWKPRRDGRRRSRIVEEFRRRRVETPLRHHCPQHHVAVGLLGLVLAQARSPSW